MRTLPSLAAITLLLSGCASVGTSPKGHEAPIEKAAMKLTSDVKDGGYRVVGAEELKKWLDEGKKPLLVSTLPVADDASFGVLPGAVSGPMPKFDKEVTQADKDGVVKAAGAEKDRTIVVYCGFVGCRRSHFGAKALVEAGFQNVYRFPGGIAAWQDLGFPLAKK